MRVYLFTALTVCLAFSGTSSATDFETLELEQYIDGVITEQMIANEIPGVTISVVKDGELIFSKGYGYADLGSMIPVSPDSTLFRIGSVSKLFVWTSVMQMVEKGELDLNENVNSYLEEFQIPETFVEPITLAHLLTHTPGFEEQELGVFVSDSSHMAPLGAYLEEYMPARVRPPGELSSYSNYGTALAAYIVQEKSGMPFHGYVEANILQPLGMHMSSFLQPPPGLADLMATGYVVQNGMRIPQEFEWIQAYPAGSMSSTADDMASFMIAHLQNGRYLDQVILGEETAVDMHSLHFTHDPRVNGWTWGFMQLNMGTDSLIWHGGDTYVFHSAIFLLPEEGLGVFVAYNCPAGARARIDLIKAFLARYRPSQAIEPPVRMETSGHADESAGCYLDIRSNFSTPEKLMTLLSPQKVKMLDEYSILFAGNRWVEIEPLVFRNEHSAELLVFRENSNGEVDTMFRGNDPTTAYLRQSWISSPYVQRTFLIVCFILFASVTVLWPFGFVGDLFSRRKNGPSAVITGILLWLLSAFSAVFILGLYRMLALEGFRFGTPAGMDLLLKIPFVTVPLTAIHAVLLVLVWKEGLWRTSARVHYSLTVIAGIVLIVWMHQWNVLFQSL